MFTIIYILNINDPGDVDFRVVHWVNNEQNTPVGIVIHHFFA